MDYVYATMHDRLCYLHFKCCSSCPEEHDVTLLETTLGFERNLCSVQFQSVNLDLKFVLLVERNP